MAKALIGHLAAFYYPGPAGGRGEFRTVRGYELEEQRLFAELQARARGQPLAVEIDVRPVRDRRTLEQNRLMWALLHKLAQAYGGTAEGCYLDQLADYGADVEYWSVPTASLPVVRRAARVVEVVELDGDRCTVRLVSGSSGFSRAQMAEFIDRIFDRLAELGVDDAETTQYYRDWRETNG